MRIKPFLSILIFLLLTSAVTTIAQTPVEISDSVNAVFKKYLASNTGKSIALLTNRNIFLAGERIWFKAYVINYKGKLDLSAHNLFADIVNDKDSVIQQLVLDNTNLRTDGAFDIPESIATGFYWIRCYTAAQLKNNNEHIFIKPVYILNKQLRDENTYAKQFESNARISNKRSPSIQFYAERLTSIPVFISTGVIEIKDANNEPLSVKGELINSKDSVLTNFTTNSFGLARLTFLNDEKENYTAVFHLNNTTVKYQLPKADKNAIQLSVINQTTATIKAFVTLEDKVLADMHTTILAVQHDSLLYAAAGKGNYGITIPLDNFPGGIVRLLLFDQNKNLVSERKIYIAKENVDIDVTPDKKEYAERENVNVNIKTTANGEPLTSVLNVAVEDESLAQLSDTMEANMLPPSNDFLLNSWLHRYSSKYSADDIDLLLATRSTDFRNVNSPDVNDEVLSYDDNSKLQNLAGKVTNKKGVGISDRIVTAMAKNTTQFFIDVDTTDKDGRFNIAMPQGFDSLQFSLQVADKHNRPVLTDSIQVENFQYPNFSTPVSLKQQFLAENINTIALLRKYHPDTSTIFQGKGWLKPVTVTTVTSNPLNYDPAKRINTISQILSSDKFRYGGYGAVTNALLQVPGVSMLHGDLVIFGFTPTADMKGYLRPLLVENGVVRGEVGKGYFDDLNPADVDFIEVLRGGEAAYYGIRGAGGVISVNLRNGPPRDYNNLNYFHGYTPVTYHTSPQFEMPDYSNNEIKNSNNVDPRTTIYWSGNIITDAKGEANVQFYTGDNFKNYAVTITGMTATGELIYKRILIEKNR